MMIFVFTLDIPKNLKCFLGCRRLYHNFLKTTLQRTVFLYILTIFIKSSGTYTLNLTTGKSRFQHIGSIHGTRRRTGPHNGMYFINEQNYIRILLQFIENRTNTLFKLSTIFSAGNNRCHIQCYHTLIKQDT